MTTHPSSADHLTLSVLWRTPLWTRHSLPFRFVVASLSSSDLCAALLLVVFDRCVWLSYLATTTVHRDRKCGSSHPSSFLPPPACRLPVLLLTFYPKLLKPFSKHSSTAHDHTNAPRYCQLIYCLMQTQHPLHVCCVLSTSELYSVYI